ncbi:MAG TPA: hypothetical protein DCS05_12700 [Nitrospiraceae bacterium]|nr:hypothetical protein [Nitrospiraceae bacterium]
MNTKKGWEQSLMISSKTKEASYGAAVAVIADNFQGIKAFSDYSPEWADVVETDKDTVSGAEHGTDLDIISQGFKVNIAQPRAKPNFVNAMVGAALGSMTPTQDGALVAYKQKIVPVAVGTALPSFNLIGKKGGLQYLHKGCKVNSITLSGEEGKALSCEAEIIGSGHRATNADSFIAEPSESWILMKNGYCWMEDGANISIAAANTQGSEDISSATPEDLKVKIKKFSWKWNNNLEGQPGFGAGNSGVFQDMDYARRTQELTFTLRFEDDAHVAFFEAATALAMEIEVKGALIAGGGAMYYGMALRIPRFKLTKAPLPQGGVGDSLTAEYSCDIQDDGTNPAVIVEVYNAIAAYYA